MKPLGSSAAYRGRDPEESGKPGTGGAVALPADAADAGLVVRMRSGDEQALGLLYDRWEHAVRTVAIGIVGDAADAEDVVEDAFWQAWRQADRFDAGRGTVGGWLVTMARSRALDRRRAMRRVREDVPLDAIDQTHGAELSESRNDPHEDLERGEQSRRLHAALNALPAEQRQSLQLAYFEGMSQTEIAARTGLALGTVKTRMRLAMQKLRGALTEETARGD